MNRKFDVNKIHLKIDTVDFWSPCSMNKGGMRIYWSADIGFGQLDIVKTSGSDSSYLEESNKPEEELAITAYTENMDYRNDKAFTKKLLELLIRKLQIED